MSFHDAILSRPFLRARSYFVIELTFSDETYLHKFASGEAPQTRRFKTRAEANRARQVLSDKGWRGTVYDPRHPRRVLA